MRNQTSAATPKSDRIVSGKAKLDRNDNKFLPNRNYRMVVSRGYGHPPLAQVDFTLLPAKGEKIAKPTGEVNF